MQYILIDDKWKKRRDRALRHIAMQRVHMIRDERLPPLWEPPKGDVERLRADVSTGAWKWRAPYTRQNQLGSTPVHQSCE